MSKSDKLKAELDGINAQLQNVNKEISVFVQRRTELEEARLQKMSEVNAALQSELENLQREND